LKPNRERTRHTKNKQTNVTENQDKAKTTSILQQSQEGFKIAGKIQIKSKKL